MQNANSGSGIYCIENIKSKKKYIGQSKNINDRWLKHISELNHNKHHNDYLQKSWNKYGGNAFTFYVLEYCVIDKLDEKEIFYIDLYNTMDRAQGYNLKSGGQNGQCNYSEETQKKMSESTKNTYQNPERRKIQRENALIQWQNPEIKKKISGKNNFMYGKHHTEEARKKISEKRKGLQSPKRNNTPVFCIELRQVFKDATEASKTLLIDSSAILKVCRKERKTCGGYHWEFLNIGE